MKRAAIAALFIYLFANDYAFLLAILRMSTTIGDAMKRVE